MLQFTWVVLGAVVVWAGVRSGTDLRALRVGRLALAALALIGAIGFHVALLGFGWGFYLWSLPMLVGLVLLLRAQLRELHAVEVRQPVRELVPGAR